MVKGKIFQGDCIKIMNDMPPNSVHSVVTDSPYGFGFLNVNWDKFTNQGFFKFSLNWSSSALRVQKPGGHLLNFGIPKKAHWMACGIEMAGYEYRDTLMWCFGDGFKKGTDIGKAIDARLGTLHERKDLGPNPNNRKTTKGQMQKACLANRDKGRITLPASKEAKQWDGWHTGLMPCYEPIVLARKPLEDTVAENTLKWQEGGLNIDACRIATNGEKVQCQSSMGGFTTASYDHSGRKYQTKGRWPGNLLLDESAATILDSQVGELSTGDVKPYKQKTAYFGTCDGFYENYHNGDKGGPSRYFKNFHGKDRLVYHKKVHKKIRNAGCEGLFWKIDGDNFKLISKEKWDALPKEMRARYNNPIRTLKPINVMRYLVRLVTPPGGTVLDPFGGSGTTAIACLIEGFNYIIIEKRECFTDIIIPRRLEFWKDPSNWSILKDHELLPSLEQKKHKSLTEWI